MADSDRRQDQRSPAGKWLDGARNFIDEKRTEIGKKLVKDAIAGNGSKSKKVK